MEISDLVRFEGNNDGGFKSIVSIIPADDIAVWPGPVAAPATESDLVKMAAGEITAKVGKRWTKIQLDQEKVNVAFSTEGSTGSLSVVHTVELMFNNLSEVEYGFLYNILNKAVVVVTKDMTNKQIAFGEPELPAYLSAAEGGFGQAIGDDKQIKTTLRSITNPMYYEDVLNYTTVV